MRVRKYFSRDIPVMADIWNEVIDECTCFPYREKLEGFGAEDFFAAQTYSAIAVDFGGNIHGVYVLHADETDPSGKTADACFAVKELSRNQKVASDLMTDCLKVAKDKGFSSFRFKNVPGDKKEVCRLCEKFGFEKKQEDECGCVYYREL